MTDDDLREAARAELCGYWAWASRRPWMWLDPGIADLGLSGMACARYTLRTGRLLTKTQAIEQVHGSAWLIDQLRARRRGEPVSSPRVRTVDALAGHPRHAHLGLPRRTAGRGLDAVSGMSARPLLRRSSALVLRFRHEMRVAGHQQFRDRKSVG